MVILFLIFFCSYYIYFIDFLGYFNNIYTGLLLNQKPTNYFLIFTHPLEPYIVQIQFCLLFCSLSTFMYMLWESLDFLKPSLYDNEFYSIKLFFF